MLGRGHIFGCQLALIVAMLALLAPAASASPACDPAVTLDDVHSGASVHGTLTCDDPSGTGLNYSIAPGGDAAHGSALLDGVGGVDYFAAPDYAGPDTFTVEVDDNEGGSTTIDVSVEVVNAAPTCNAVGLDSIAPGQTSYGSADCSDADGDSLTYTLSSPPAHGTASVDGGFIQYTPDDGYAGPDSFEYTASDGVASSASATVSVSVINHAPTCTEDSRTLRTGKAYTWSVATCSDEDFQDLTLSAGTEPQHGSVTFGDDGFGGDTATYTPANGFTGTDSFTVVANDGYDDSAPALVNVTVTPNHAPVCQTFAQHTKPATQLLGNVFCTDEDSQDATALTYAVVSGVTSGTLDLQSNAGYGSFTYTPANGFSGADQFTFSASDGDLTTQAVQKLHVASGPYCDSLAPISVRSGRSASVTPDCTKPADDFGTLTYVIDTQPTRGTATVDAFGGSFTYTAAEDATGADSFSFHMSSSSTGNSPVVTQQITTGPAVNEDPTCSDSGTQTAYAGRTATMFPFCTDPDADPLIYSVPDQPAHGTSSVSGSALHYTPAADYEGADSVPFTVTDNYGASTRGALTVDVKPPEAPTCQDPGTAPTVRPGGSVTLWLDCSNPQGDPQTYAVDTAPAHGTLGTFDDDGHVTYTADADAPTGSDSMTLHADDAVGSSGPKTFHVNIDPDYNRPPVCQQNSFSPRAVRKNTARSLGFTDVCSDPDGDPITFTRMSSPANGTLSAGPAATLTYTPATDYLGPDSFTYTATDSRGASSDVSTYYLSVVASIAPTCTTRPTLTLRPSMQRPVTFDCEDPDLQQVTYKIVTGPAHGTLSPAGDSTSSTRTYTAGATEGADSFTYRATSAGGDSVVYTQNITIDSTYNTAPQCISNPALAQDVQAGGATALNVPCSDAEDDELTAEAAGLGPAHGAVDFSGGGISYTPAAGYSGPDQFGFKVSDGHGGTTQSTLYVTVHPAPANTAPACNAVSVSTPTATPVSVQLECTDADSDDLTLSILDGPEVAKGSLGAIDQATQQVQLTPAADYSGDVTFTYRAWDGIVFSDPATVTVTVQAPVVDGGGDGGDGGSGDSGAGSGAGSGTGGGSTPGDQPPASPPPSGGPPPAGGSANQPLAPGMTLGSIPKQKLANVLKKGFAFNVSCSSSCTVVAKLLLASKLAKKLKLAAADIALGTGKQSLGGGSKKLVVKLSAKARKRLKNVRSIKLKLLLTATTPSGGKQSLTKTLTLRL
jgi:hypothetical protein